MLLSPPGDVAQGCSAASTSRPQQNELLLTAANCCTSYVNTQCELVNNLLFIYCFANTISLGECECSSILWADTGQLLLTVKSSV